VLNGVVIAALDRVQSARRAKVVARLVQDDLSYMKAVLEAEMAEGVWKRLTPAGVASKRGRVREAFF